MGWSSICLRFPQSEPEIMLDGMLNFKSHFMVWYCGLIWTLQWSLLNVWIWLLNVRIWTFNWVWHELCNGLFNIRNLVSSLILMFVRICLCDTILYTWFGKKWKRLKKFWGWKIWLVYAYFFKHLSLKMLIKKECMMEVFCKNTFGLKAVNYFFKKFPSLVFTRVLNTPLTLCYLLEQFDVVRNFRITETSFIRKIFIYFIYSFIRQLLIS